MFLMFYKTGVRIVKCSFYFCCVLFAHNSTVDLKDIKELEGMVSALGKFARELERNKSKAL